MKLFIAIDLDGVMVDLDRGLKEQLDVVLPVIRSPENQRYVDGVWDTTHATYNFWTNLPPMPHFEELYQSILAKCDEPVIISASPVCYEFDERHDRCRQQKIDWVARYLGPEQAKRTIITKSNLKHTFISQIPADRHVLVDDHSSNIRRWNKAGGIGILYKHHEKALKELNSL